MEKRNTNIIGELSYKKNENEFREWGKIYCSHYGRNHYASWNFVE